MGALSELLLMLLEVESMEDPRRRPRVVVDSVAMVCCCLTKGLCREEGGVDASIIFAGFMRVSVGVVTF